MHFCRNKEGRIPALSGTVSAGELGAFSFVAAVIWSDGLYDSCGASGTAVYASVSELSDCFKSGRISPLTSVAHGIPVVPKGVGSL